MTIIKIHKINVHPRNGPTILVTIVMPAVPVGLTRNSNSYLPSGTLVSTITSRNGPKYCELHKCCLDIRQYLQCYCGICVDGLLFAILISLHSPNVTLLCVTHTAHTHTHTSGHTLCPFKWCPNSVPICRLENLAPLISC